jgi:tryptophan-rich sensory protein
MVKSSVPVFVLIFAFLFRLEKPTVKLISVMAVIIFGVLLMVLKQTEFNMVGYIQVQLAAVSSGFRWALTQVLLEKESMGMSNPLATNIFLSPLMATSLLIASLSLENWYEMLTSPFFKTFDSTMHISAIIIFGGFLAFTMLICEFRLIAATSVVTFSVAGIFKEVLTISVSMIIFGDRLNTINIIGLVISIIGIGMYNYIRVVALLKARTDHTSSTLLISNADSTEFDPSTPEGTIQELIPGGYLPSSLVGYHPITELTSSPTYAHDETINADEYEDMELNDIEKELATSTKHNTQMPFRIGTLDSPRHKIID